MKLRGRWCVLALGLLIGTALSGRLVAQDGIGLPPGTTPGPAVIEDLDGRPVDLGQWVGKKPVLFEFWATWCPQCAALLPEMEAMHARYGDRVDFVVIAVAVNQSKRSVRRHLERHPMPFTFLWDTDGNAVRAFQAYTTSYVVVLDARGKVVYTGSGSDQRLEAALARALSSD